MKRLIVIISTLILCVSLKAQYYVYEINGEVFVKGTEWTSAYKTMQVQPSDLIRTNDYSSVVILDRNQNKLYSLQSTSSASLKTLIQGQRNGGQSLLGEVAQALYNVLFKSNDKSMDAYQRTSGVTYRDQDDDMLIAQALKSSSSSHGNVSFRLINEYTGTAISGAKVGEMAVVEVTNNTSKGLYINIADFDSAGNAAPILPADENNTMTHLYMPAHSVVRLSNYPIEFYEPCGTDKLVLVAYHKPFNMMNVLQLMPTVPAIQSDDVHIYSSHMTISR